MVIEKLVSVPLSLSMEITIYNVSFQSEKSLWHEIHSKDFSMYRNKICGREK